MSKRKYNKQLKEGWTNMGYFMWDLLRSCTATDGIPNTHSINDQENISLKFHIKKEAEQYFCMCKICGKIIYYEEATIDRKNDAYCPKCSIKNKEEGK